MEDNRDYREMRNSNTRRQRYTRNRGYNEKYEYRERPAFSRNYREGHLYPRERRGYRDERNYMRGFRSPKRSYPSYRNRRMADGPHRETMPQKEEMDRLLAEYMSKKA